MKALMIYLCLIACVTAGLSLWKPYIQPSERLATLELLLKK